ncbi:MAG: hypothetical protein RIM99_10235 [Cyclobacteriaceae bacterium]
MATEAGKEAKQVAGALTSMGIDEMISNLAIGIARGQMKLDEACMKIAQFMGDAQIDFGKKPGSNLPDQISLMELGFTPNFYQFVDTILEIKVAISSQFEETREFDTSTSNVFQSENENHSSYEYNRSNSNSGSGYGYSRGGRVGWGWGGVSWGYGGSGYNYGYSNSSNVNSKSSSSNKQKALTATTVDAKYASTYNYAVEAASSIKTKIVPVPPPDVFEEIIRGKIQERREWEELMNRQYEVGSIIPELNTQVDLIQNGLVPISSTNEQKVGTKTFSVTVVPDGIVPELGNQLELLNEKYQQITTDHWSALKGSVTLREHCDNALQNTLNAHTAWVADPDTISQETKTGFNTAIESFLSKLDDVRGLLSPEVIEAIDNAPQETTEPEPDPEPES